MILEHAKWKLGWVEKGCPRQTSGNVHSWVFRHQTHSFAQKLEGLGSAGTDQILRTQWPIIKTDAIQPPHSFKLSWGPSSDNVPLIREPEEVCNYKLWQVQTFRTLLRGHHLPTNTHVQPSPERIHPRPWRRCCTYWWWNIYNMQSLRTSVVIL